MIWFPIEKNKRWTITRKADEPFLICFDGQRVAKRNNFTAAVLCAVFENARR